MPTLKDLANETGLNVGTVSRILNNRGYISEQSRKKVYEAMKRLNYQPNEVARSLIKRHTNTIGIIMPHISHPYFAYLISQLERAASLSGHKILLCNSREQADRERDYINMCTSNRVSGIVICSASVDALQLADLDVPVVVIEKWHLKGIHSVHCDNYQGGMLATEHLIQKGCRHLLHFGGVISESMPADDRASAFFDVARRHQVEAHEVKTTQESYYQSAYYDLILEALKTYPQADGIFASSDLIAAQTLQVCADLGRRVPEDIKVVGFDDVLVSTLTTPPITTVHQPIKEMAEAAINIILKKNRGDTVPVSITLPAQLVERRST